MKGRVWKIIVQTDIGTSEIRFRTVCEVLEATSAKIGGKENANIVVSREIERAHTKRSHRRAWYRDPLFPTPAVRIRDVTVVLAPLA